MRPSPARTPSEDLTHLPTHTHDGPPDLSGGPSSAVPAYPERAMPDAPT